MAERGLYIKELFNKDRSISHTNLINYFIKLDEQYGIDNNPFRAIIRNWFEFLDEDGVKRNYVDS